MLWWGGLELRGIELGGCGGGGGGRVEVSWVCGMRVRVRECPTAPLTTFRSKSGAKKSTTK